MTAEAFIKQALDGRFWWVDDFGTVRVIAVTPDCIPRHTRANGVPQVERAVLKPMLPSGPQRCGDVAIDKVLPATKPVAESIIQAVSEATDVSTEMLRARNRTPEYVRARFIAYYVIRVVTGMSFIGIAKLFGRDHNTSVQLGAAKVAAHPAFFEPELSAVMAKFNKLEAA